jgi:hypothetical protein
MSEKQLPDNILEKASLRGEEYAWKFEDIKDVILASKNLKLATLGGQAQFRFPDGPICELYWIDIDIQDQKETESWTEFVNRSANEFLKEFDNRILKVDFLKEAKGNKFLETKLEGNIDILKDLCFVVYIVNEKEYDDLKQQLIKNN